MVVQPTRTPAVTSGLSQYTRRSKPDASSPRVAGLFAFMVSANFSKRARTERRAPVAISTYLAMPPAAGDVPAVASDALEAKDFFTSSAAAAGAAAAAAVGFSSPIAAISGLLGICSMSVVSFDSLSTLVPGWCWMFLLLLSQKKMMYCDGSL